jgi:hypothetical protein
MVGLSGTAGAEVSAVKENKKHWWQSEKKGNRESVENLAEGKYLGDNAIICAPDATVNSLCGIASGSALVSVSEQTVTVSSISTMVFN